MVKIFVAAISPKDTQATGKRVIVPSDQDDPQAGNRILSTTSEVPIVQNLDSSIDTHVASEDAELVMEPSRHPVDVVEPIVECFKLILAIDRRMDSCSKSKARNPDER